MGTVTWINKETRQKEQCVRVRNIRNVRNSIGPAFGVAENALMRPLSIYNKPIHKKPDSGLEIAIWKFPKVTLPPMDKIKTLCQAGDQQVVS